MRYTPVPASLLTALAVMLLSAGCLAPIEYQSSAQSVEPGSAREVRALVRLDTGLLNLSAMPGDRLLEADFAYTEVERQPRVGYEVNDGVGMLTVDQPQRQGLPLGRDENRWTLRLSHDLPLHLAVELGSGIHSLNLNGLMLAGLDVSASGGSATALNLTGYWPQDLDVTIRAESGSVTVQLPAGTGSRVEVLPGSGKLDPGNLKPDGDAYVNDAYGRSASTLRVTIDPGQAQVTLTAGLPGDRRIEDVLLGARLTYSSQTWQCDELPAEERQAPPETVSEMWTDYICERGPEHVILDGSNPLTVELARSELVDRIRRQYYAGGEPLTEETLEFNIPEFVSATGDMIAGLRGRDTVEFSVTHFIGSFDYTIEPEDDRLRFAIVNQTDRASGTHFPMRFPSGGYTQSVEALVEANPGIADTYLLELLGSSRYPVVSILEPKSREETLEAEGEGGGAFIQTFTWTEQVLPYEADDLPFWQEYLPLLNIR